MSLKTAFEPYFKMGAALSGLDMQNPAHTELVKEEFSSFTCENDMKPMFFLDGKTNQQNPEKYNNSPAVKFDHAIPYLEFARESGIPMRGHTLVWHNQTPKWFFYQNYDVSGTLADRETMLARLDGYIHSVLDFIQTEYPGIIYAWDVVNEAVDEGDFRKSLWLETVGRDFVEKAFESARRYAAPGVALFYNDYETAQEWKRDFIISEILKPLMEKKLVDGMGMQSHLLMDHPDMKDYRTALEMYGALGLEIQITELDMHNADPSRESMDRLAERYRELFTILVNAKKEGKANVTSVTFWNLLDEFSWLSGFRREKSYPLLFCGDCERKEAYYKVLEVVGGSELAEAARARENSRREGRSVGKKSEERTELQEVYDFLKSCQTYYLATVEGDQPRVRPFGTVDLFEGKLYIQTGKVKNVSKQLQANPKAELCAFEGGKWLRVAGKLMRDDRIQAKTHMLDAYPHLKGMYSAEDDNTEVLYFEDAVATFSSFTEPPREIRF